MIIRTLLKPRKGGSRVTIAKKEYHFVFDEKYDAEVCDVKDERAQKIFLGIREGYRAVDPDDQPELEEEEPVEEEFEIVTEFVDDEEDDNSYLLSLDPVKMTNKELNAFCKDELDTNFKSKVEIEKKGKEFGVDLDRRANCANMIRELLVFLQAQVSE